MRRRAVRSSATITILAIVLGRLGGDAAPTLRVPSPASPTVACSGAHDLVVDGDQVTMTGTDTFDHVCLQNKATLRIRGTLRAGVLFVDKSSHLSNDGQLDVAQAQDLTTCDGGLAGGRLAILVREAIVFGHISANGEAGYEGLPGCGYDGGNGGNGGQITLEAAMLTLQGAMSATGGSGGAGYTGDPTIGSHGGNGANGGSITLITGQPLTAAIKVRLHVDGGRGGHPGSDHVRTRSGRNGRIALSRLSPAQWGRLPPPPPDDSVELAPSPARASMLPSNVFATGIACGRGDLRLAPEGGMTLGGSHTYNHICLGRGATLTANGPLLLHAKTIVLDPGATLFGAASLTAYARTIVLRTGATIQADAVIGTKRHGLDTGRYQDAGACQPDRSAVHPGLPGTPGQTGQAPGTTSYLDEQIYTPQAGAGGGAITLIATRIFLAGTLSAIGGDGEPGADGFTESSYVAPPTRGAGGGSGGGIMVMADDLQLSGHISVAGGLGGVGGQWDPTDVADGGMHGGVGCIKLFATTLRTSARTIPVVGSVVLGRR